MTTKIERRIKIKYRVRNKVSGTAERPRMSVLEAISKFTFNLLMIWVERLWLQHLLWA